MEDFYEESDSSFEIISSEDELEINSHSLEEELNTPILSILSLPFCQTKEESPKIFNLESNQIEDVYQSDNSKISRPMDFKEDLDFKGEDLGNYPKCLIKENHDIIFKHENDSKDCNIVINSGHHEFMSKMKMEEHQFSLLDDINHKVMSNLHFTYEQENKKSLSIYQKNDNYYTSYIRKKEHVPSWKIDNSHLNNDTRLYQVIVHQPKQDIPNQNRFSSNRLESSCNEKDNAENLNMCKWIRNNAYLGFIYGKAKSSFYALMKTLEEIKELFDYENKLKLTIVGNEKEALAINDGFARVFISGIDTTTIDIFFDSIPALAVGFSSALQAIDQKIKYIRCQNMCSNDAIVISCMPLIIEMTDKRWQSTIMIYLEDPKLHLTLFNYAHTTPIPNEFVNKAEEMTGKNYRLREHGLAVTLEDVMKSMVQAISLDFQYYLTGITYYTSIRNAVEALAGMYKKYLV